MSNELGELSARYRMIRRLGTGGMGEVFLAQDSKLDRPVAIKLMTDELAKDPAQRKRFLTEAKAASALMHPNVCVIHEVAETEQGRLYLVMEYIDGRTLEAVLRDRRLELAEVAALGLQLAEGLAAANARGIVHRDIKPANVMIDRQGRAKILDFGLAKRCALEGTSPGTSTAGAQTQAGVLLGTPHYMSPEQALGRPLDHRTDIFSFGLLLYEMATGGRPFLGSSLGETINNVVNRVPSPPGLGSSTRGAELERVILRCLEKDPGNRYHSAAEVAEDLRALGGSSLGAISRAAAPALVRHLSRSAGRESAEPTKLWRLAAQASRSWRGSLMRALAVAVVAAAALWGAVWWLRDREARPGAAPSAGAGNSLRPSDGVSAKSVAVLPFDNFSAEPDTDYLSDGLTEEITTALSRISGLKVAARNSAFAFKGKKEDARRVGEALRVAVLLQGSVRKVGNRIRVAAQLINASDGFQMWTETYDRGLEDVLAVQDEIARNIARRMQMEIAGDAAIQGKKPVSAEAHSLYLQGRHAWNKRTPRDIAEAIGLLNKAIEMEPRYADAYAALASCYAVLPEYATRSYREFLPQATAAAKRAIELDPAVAEGYAVLGAALVYSGDYAEGERRLREAIRLNPNFATAHHWLGLLLREEGRMEEAREEYRAAEELDPLSPIIKANVVLWRLRAGQLDAAMEDARRHLAVHPRFPLFRIALATALLKQGRFQEALTEIEAGRQFDPDAANWLALAGYARARLGEEAEARRAIEELQRRQARGFAVGADIALVYVGLRDFERACEVFESAIEFGEVLIGDLNSVLTDELRATPRFQQVLRKHAALKSQAQF